MKFFASFLLAAGLIQALPEFYDELSLEDSKSPRPPTVRLFDDSEYT
jgi:hypothetical protein